MNLPRLKQIAINSSHALAVPKLCHSALTVFDPDLLAEAVRDSDLEHHQVHHGPFRGELFRAEMKWLIIEGGHYSQTLIVRGGFSPDRITIGIPLSDRETGYVNGMCARAHDLVVFPEGGEIDYVMPANTKWAAVQLEHEALVAVGVPEQSIERMSVISPLAGQHGRLVRLVCSALDGHVSPQKEQAFRDALLEELYQALDPDRKKSRCANFYDRAELVRRFERLIESQGVNKYSVAELAKTLGVGRRTLEQVFSDYVGLSPARYITMMRLNAIRRELLNACEDNLSVAELAERNGIVHLGRFAADYRRMFGELPSQTLRRARYPALPA
jgi:AraC family ethanolamine operon transcriptional activator